MHIIALCVLCASVFPKRFKTQRHREHREAMIVHLVLPAFEPSQKKDFNRVLYEGEFRDDKLNGQGKKIRHVFGRTHVYEGEFKDDKLNGQGKTNSSFGYIEEGEFIDDHLHKGKKFHHGVVIYEVENGEIKFPGKK